MYPTLPCPLSFAEEVAVRTGQASNAHLLDSAACAAARAQESDSSSANGDRKLVSLMDALPLRFRSWQRVPAELALQHAC